MNSLSPLVAWLLVFGTVGVAAVFAVQQFRTFTALPDLPPEDVAYHRAQARRRLVGCALLVVIAALIAGSFLSGLEDRVEQLGNDIRAKADAGDRQLAPEQEQLKTTYALYWIGVLLLLLALVIVAAVDLFAIRRFGARHMKKLRAERKEMIEREVAAYRRERARRNGTNGPAG